MTAAEDNYFIKIINLLDEDPIKYSLYINSLSNIADAVRNGEQDSMLLFLRHTPVLTMGKGMRSDADMDNITTEIDMNIDAMHVDRGGKMTYHDPGQLICYPIMNLARMCIRPGEYVQFLHDWLTSALSDLGCNLANLDDKTGVWIYNDQNKAVKVGFVGVSIQNGVTRHGFALNLFADLDIFYKFPVCSMGYTKMIDNLYLSHAQVAEALLSNLQLRRKILYERSAKCFFTSFFSK